MGKRSQQLVCRDCRERWWVWFDNKARRELLSFADSETCPECGSNDWQLTDATRFAGSVIHTTDETCPECDYDATGTVILRCGSQHEWIPHEDIDDDPPTKAAYREAIADAKRVLESSRLDWGYLDGEERHGTLVQALDRLDVRGDGE